MLVKSELNTSPWRGNHSNYRTFRRQNK